MRNRARGSESEGGVAIDTAGEPSILIGFVMTFIGNQQPVGDEIMSGRRIFGFSCAVAALVLATAWNNQIGAAERAAGTTGTASSRSADKLPSSAASDQDIITYINERIRKGWKDNELQPSGKCSDAEWCRRVYLDVLGRIPSVKELDYFLTIKGNRKAILIERLLDTDSKYPEWAGTSLYPLTQKYSEEFARSWTTTFTNMLIGRPKPAREEERDMVDREGMQQYLRMLVSREQARTIGSSMSWSAPRARTSPAKKATTAPRTSCWITCKSKLPQPPRRPHDSSWDCRCNARSATTIRSMNGSRTSFGV